MPSIYKNLVDVIKSKLEVPVGTSNESVRINWLKKLLSEIPSGSRILDAGAGEQKFKKFCNHLEYVAQDFAQYDGQGDSQGLQTGVWQQDQLDIVSDLTNIPEPNESFDAILCVEVFEHLPNPLLALKEFSRLLKKEGQLIITAPFCSLTHFSPYHFYSGFNRYFYETHLSSYSFTILDLQANGNFFEFLAQELRRLPSIAQRYTKERPGKLEMLALYLVLQMLDRFSKKNNDSEELLCFGYQVHAVKR